MQFESRVALEAEIDVCSTRVRELQELVRKSDGGVTIEQVAEQVKQLVALRKELQLWKAQEEAEEEALAAQQQQDNDNNASNQHSDSNAAAASATVSSPTNSSGKKKRKNKKKKAAAAAAADVDAEPAPASNSSSGGDSSNEADEPALDDASGKAPEEPQQDDDPVAATADVTDAVDNQTEDDGAVLEDSLKKAQRMQQATEFLANKAAAVEKNTTAEPVAVMTESKTQSKKSKKASVSDESTASAADLVAVNDKLQAKIVALETQLAEEQARATEAQTAHSSVSTEQLAKVTELEQQLAATKIEAQDVQRAHAALIDVESALRAEQTQLLASVAELKETNAQLAKKVEDAVASDVQLRHELTELQSLLKQTEDAKSENDTNFRKLWKTIDEFQAANDKLTKKNAQLEADAKSVRVEAEKAAKELSVHSTRTKELASDLATAQSALSASAAQVEALTAEVVELRVENAVLAEKLAAAKSSAQSSADQIAALESKLAQSKQEAAAAIAQSELLAAKLDAAATIHNEEKLNLTSLLANLQTENSGLLAKNTELESVVAEAKSLSSSAVAENEEAAKSLHALKDEVMTLKLTSEKAAEQAAESVMQAKTLALELSVSQEALAAVTKQVESSGAHRVGLEAEVQSLRALAASQEEMLKKTRSSMFEANEELKEAHKHTAKWKSSAQTANAQLNEKASEADKAKKQLAKLRAELAAAETARKQLADNAKEKEKKAGKAAHEVQVLKEKLAALEAEASALKQAGVSSDAMIKKLTDANIALAKSSQEAQTYRQAIMGLIPLVVAAIFYAVAK